MMRDASLMTTLRLEFGVLGPVELRRDGVPVPAGGPKQRALLAYLVLNARSAVPIDTLVDALWEAPPKSARKIVQIYLSRLQRLLEADVLSNERGHYGLEVEDEQIDLGRFQRLVRDGERGLRGGEPAAAARRLRAALGLWRGHALADLAGEPFVTIERARLEELRVGALERRIDADLATGEHTVVAELEGLVAQHPLREHLRAQLMLALYRAGRQAEALEVYRTARKLLIEELGVEPGGELKRLEHAILVQDPTLDVTPPTEVQRRPSLPSPPAPLIGRESELAEARILLARPSGRLLTVTGAPGAGKTRLALELAVMAAPEFTDGAVFVDLAPIADPALLPSAIAQALGVPEGEESVLRSVQRFLGEREVLVVLDNFEHLLPAAPVLSEVLSAAPGLKLLVTSRAVLRLRAEQEFRLEPLELESAVDLFVERARSVEPSFRLTEENRAAVADICGRVDRLPLALELAAAHIRLLGVHELATRLGRPLRLLGDGARDLPPRQRTLRATIDWSYRLLGASEKRLFTALTVFVGGWTLEAAEAVCGGRRIPVEEVLDSLVGKSLVRRQGDEEGRFSMLETIREYALELLARRADEDDLRRRHADWYVGLAERSDLTLTGPSQAVALERLAAEHGNLRAAFEFTLVQEPGLALRLAVALRGFWYVRGYMSEGRQMTDAAIRAAGKAASPLLVRALTEAGVFAAEQGDLETARASFEHAIAASRAIGMEEGVASNLTNLGNLALIGARHDEAARLFEEAADLHERLGRERARGIALRSLGFVAQLQGKLERAETLHRESVEIARRREDLDELSRSLRRLGETRLAAGQADRAEPLLRESLGLAYRLRDAQALAGALSAYAALLTGAGAARDSAILLGAADAVREASGVPEPASEAAWHAERVERTRAQVGPDEFELLLEHGRHLPIEDALALVATPA
jgi:predicted ATPase/DNA-binding SARP family transcriptional activator